MALSFTDFLSQLGEISVRGAAAPWHHGTMVVVEQPPLEISVRGLGGHLCHVKLPAESRLIELKEAIAAELDMCPFRQRLVYGLEELICEDAIADFEPGQAVDIVLIQRPEESARLLREFGALESSEGRQAATLLGEASEDAQADRDVVMMAVSLCGEALCFASSDLRSDREVVLAAVAQCAAALIFASAELKGDHEVVLTAVGQDGAALQFARAELRSDPKFVELAIKRSPSAQYFADEELALKHGFGASARK